MRCSRPSPAEEKLQGIRVKAVLNQPGPSCIQQCIRKLILVLITIQDRQYRGILAGPSHETPIPPDRKDLVNYIANLGNVRVSAGDVDTHIDGPD